MNKNKQIHVRITCEEKDIIIKKAINLGFKQISEYLRFVGLNAETKVKIKEK